MHNHHHPTAPPPHRPPPTAPPPYPTDLAMHFKDYHPTPVGASTGSADAIERAYPTLARMHHPDVSNGPCVEACCDAEADEIGAICDVERRTACSTAADHRSSGRTQRTSRGLADSRRGSPPWSRPCAGTAASRPVAAVATPIAAIFSVHRSAAAAALTAFHRLRRPSAPSPKPGGQLRFLGNNLPGTTPGYAYAQRVLTYPATGGANAPALPRIAPTFTASALATSP